MALPDVGQKLHARYDGYFYAAEVVALAKGKKSKAPVKVSFKGWEGEETWVSLGDLKCKALGLKGENAKPEPAAKAAAKAKSKSQADAKISPAELPDVGMTVRTKKADGKVVTAKVVAAKLQLQFSDGTTKWCTPDDVKFKRPPTKVFACTICGQEFKTEAARDNHWWDAHIVTCPECGRIFDNEAQRDEHWWEEHVVYCKQCGKICQNIGALVQHTREVHAMRCKQCNKECSSIRSLVQHARDTHQYAQNLIALPCTGSKKK